MDCLIFIVIVLIVILVPYAYTVESWSGRKKKQTSATPIPDVSPSEEALTPEPSLVVEDPDDSSSDIEENEEPKSPFPVRSSAVPLNEDRGRHKIGTETWVPPGKGIDIQGYRLSRGMFYVGSALFSDVYSRRKARCLIVPHLKVESDYPDRDGKTMIYWPSYSAITPAARAAYLEFLAGGANDPDAFMGYVYLYFYGLEWRLMNDENVSEIPDLLAEVERLLGLYGSRGKFDEYAEKLIYAARLKWMDQGLFRQKPRIVEGKEVSLTTRVALAQAVASGEPIPAAWVLAWLFEDPETALPSNVETYLRELEDLFRIRFDAAYPEGFRLEATRSKLGVDYYAASTDFTTKIETNLPDVSRLKQPLNRVRPILETCCKALVPYGRYVERNPENNASPYSISLLPDDLAMERILGQVNRFSSWVHQQLEKGDPVEIDGGELASYWAVHENALLTPEGGIDKKEAEAVAKYLGLLGAGVEPDPYQVSALPGRGQPLVLFRRENSVPVRPGDRYVQAATILKVLFAVSQADPDISPNDRDQFAVCIKETQTLDPDESARFEALYRYLMINPPSYRKLNQEIGKRIPADSKKTIAMYVLMMAVADGRIDVLSSVALRKLYAILGRDPSAIPIDYKMLVVGRRSGGTPVRATRAESSPEESPVRTHRAVETGRPDTEFVRAKMADSRRALNLLTMIFSDEKRIWDDGPVYRPIVAHREAALFEGLDNAHAALLVQLLTGPTWTRKKYEEIVRSLGLPADSALATINDWATDRLGTALVEDSEPIWIYQAVWNQYTEA